MRRYDFWLVMITIAVLTAMGILAFGGTIYTWWAEVTTPGFAGSPSYAAYSRTMDALVAPFVVVLVVVLGLCIPRRLFDRRALWWTNGGLVAAGLVAWAVAGPKAGAATFLGLAAVLQAAVILLTVARAGGLTYLVEGTVYQVGSALLHLGFVVVVLDWVALPDSPLHLAVFWTGTALLVAGSALCFYRKALGRLSRGPTDRPPGYEA